jgi:hypothetical protein
MFKSLIETFRIVHKDNELKDYEEALRKIDEKRMALKAKAMQLQKRYDELRSQK